MSRPEATITVDPAGFEPMRIQPVTHSLVGHPLLELGALVDFARRMIPVGAVRHHSGAVKPDTNFIEAPRLHPVQRSPEEVIANIEHANAWFSLHNIQIDPVYRGLVDELLDSVRPIVERKDPGMHFRAGWIFVSSPGAITPYHLDHEHNFILQVRGHKTVHVFDPHDRSIVTDEALELFHGRGSRELVQWTPATQTRARSFNAVPGIGAYMPSTAPHWVENGSEPSITISVTYFTRATRRRRALFQLNESLRRRGVKPGPVGAHPVADAIKAQAFERWLDGRKRLSRLRNLPFHDLDVPYATNPPGSGYGM